MVYITGMNRIRHFFHEAAPASRPYFVLPIYDDEPALYRSKLPCSSTGIDLWLTCAQPSDQFTRPGPTGTTRPFDGSALTSRRLATYPKIDSTERTLQGAGHVSAPQLGAAGDAGHIGNCS
jgi:hypothetical protein